MEWNGTGTVLLVSPNQLLFLFVQHKFYIYIGTLSNNNRIQFVVMFYRKCKFMVK